MSPSAVSVAVTGALTLALAWMWRREFGAWKLEERVAAALVPPVLFAAVLLLVKTPAGDLDRLSGSFELASKLGLSAPEARGPASKPGEGPVASAAYLPLLLFRSPAAMSAAAGFLAALFLLIPLAVVHLGSGGHRPPFPLLAFLLSCLVCLFFGAAIDFATAPAAGFALLACACLASRGEEAPPSTGSLVLSGVFSFLSLGAVPMAAPIVVGLAMYLWNAWGLKWGGRYLLCVAGAAAGMTLVLLPIFGFRELWAVLAADPFGAPWQDPGWPGLRRSGQASLIQGWPLLAGLGVLGVLRAPQAAAEEARLRRGPWVVPLFTGLLTVPAALAAGAKTGTRDPSFLVLLQLLASLSLLLAAAAGTGGDERSRRLCRGIGVALAIAALAFTAARILDVWKR